MSKMQHNCKLNEGIDDSLVGGVSGKKNTPIPQRYGRRDYPSPQGKGLGKLCFIFSDVIPRYFFM